MKTYLWAGIIAFAFQLHGQITGGGGVDTAVTTESNVAKSALATVSDDATPDVPPASVPAAAANTLATATKSALSATDDVTTRYGSVEGNSGGTVNVESDAAGKEAIAATTSFAATAPSLPFMQTLAATAVTSTTAQLSASLSPNGSALSGYFEFGLSTAYGSTTPLGSFGTAPLTISFTVTGLIPDTVYHYRFFGWNSVGQSSGGDVTFKTSPNLSVPTSGSTTASPPQVSTSPTTTAPPQGTEDAIRIVVVQGQGSVTASGPNIFSPITTTGELALRATSSGLPITITATPATGWKLREWRKGGAEILTTSQITVPTTAPLRIEAYFETAQSTATTTQPGNALPASPSPSNGPNGGATNSSSGTTSTNANTGTVAPTSSTAVIATGTTTVTVPTNAQSSRIGSISMLSLVGIGSPVACGFSIVGTTPKRVVIRVIGPTLKQFGVSAALSDPQFRLFDSSGKQIDGNDDWSGTTELSNAFNTGGMFPLSLGSRDSALLVTLNPGVYTVQALAKGDASGLVLFEVYELL